VFLLSMSSRTSSCFMGNPSASGHSSRVSHDTQRFSAELYFGRVDGVGTAAGGRASGGWGSLSRSGSRQKSLTQGTSGDLYSVKMMSRTHERNISVMSSNRSARKFNRKVWLPRRSERVHTQDGRPLAQTFDIFWSGARKTDSNDDDLCGLTIMV